MKPDKQGEFVEKAGDWFVMEQSIQMKRKPGLLKPEFVSTNGCYVGLSPKSYIVTNNINNQTEIKKGSKGENNLTILIY